MKKKLLLIATVLLEMYALAKWYGCNKFADRYYFSALDLKLRLEEAIHLDSDQSHAIARLFHNKVIGGAIDLYTIILHYFDIQFLISLLSLFGVISACIGIWYLIRTKRKSIIFFIFLISVLVVIESLFRLDVPFLVKVMLIALPWQVVSLYGVSKASDALPNNTYRYTLFGSMYFISIWWIMTLGSDLGNFCLK